MFKFITLTFICMIVMAGVEAAQLQSKNMMKAKSQAKALVDAYEKLQETMDVMEDNEEFDQGDFDLAHAFNQGINNLKHIFHF